MKKAFIYKIILLLFPVFSLAQEITGVWKGELYVDSTKKYHPFELTISEYKGKYTGYSRISFEENGTTQIVFRDHTIKYKDGLIIVEDDTQLAKASSVSQPKEVKKVMILTLMALDSIKLLSGSWSTNKTRRYLAATGSVKMQQRTDYRSTEIFKKLDSLALTGKLSFTKPANAEPPKEEEAPRKFDKVILPGISKHELPQKMVSAPGKIINPQPYIKPAVIPLVKINTEPAVPLTKPVITAIAAVKKPAAIPVKSTPVIKPKGVVAAKVYNPSDPKSSAATIKTVKPNTPEIIPAAKKSSPLPELKNAAVDVSKRSVSSMQSLFFRSDSLQLTLYDNGEIDGDTVSVLLNGKVIIAKQGLTTKPNVYTIYFERDTPDSQMLVMYAENLGSIPPNTGLLVVKEGQSVYEVRFSADLKTNAAVILRRKKDE